MLQGFAAINKRLSSGGVLTGQGPRTHTPPCSLLLPWHYYFAPSPYRSSCLASGVPFSWRIPQTGVSFWRQVLTGVSSRRQVLTGISLRQWVPSWCTTWLLNCSDLSRVPPLLHRSPPLLHGSPSIITGPVLSFTVPFHLHGSRPVLHGSLSILTGPLPFSWVPSSPSLVPFCIHGTHQMSLYG